MIHRRSARNTGTHLNGLREIHFPVVERRGEDRTDNEPERLHAEGLSATRQGPVGLLRDLQELNLLASLLDGTGDMVK